MIMLVIHIPLLLTLILPITINLRLFGWWCTADGLGQKRIILRVIEEGNEQVTASTGIHTGLINFWIESLLMLFMLGILIFSCLTVVATAITTTWVRPPCLGCLGTVTDRNWPALLWLSNHWLLHLLKERLRDFINSIIIRSTWASIGSHLLKNLDLLFWTIACMLCLIVSSGYFGMLGFVKLLNLLRREKSLLMRRGNCRRRFLWFLKLQIHYVLINSYYNCNQYYIIT
jgi:hypothetical protein